MRWRPSSRAPDSTRSAPSLVSIASPFLPIEGAKLQLASKRSQATCSAARAFHVVLRNGRHQLGDRPAMPGDGDLLASLDPLEQAGQMCLRFEGAYLTHATSN